jgi:hypothetical protein
MIPDLDTTSQTWRALERWALNEIEMHHRRLEQPDTPQNFTDYLRGRIGTLRELIALGSPPMPMPLMAGKPTKAGY